MAKNDGVGAIAVIVLLALVFGGIFAAILDALVIGVVVAILIIVIGFIIESTSKANQNGT